MIPRYKFNIRTFIPALCGASFKMTKNGWRLGVSACVFVLLLSGFVIGQRRVRAAINGTPLSAPAGPIDESLLKGMRWRQVGPFRGGRVEAVTGVPGEPGLFYF